MRAPALLAIVISIAFAPAAFADEAKADAKKDAPKPDPTLAMPPRPEPLADTELVVKPVPWQRYVEIGGDFAIVTRPVSVDGDGVKTGVRLQSAPGFGVHGGFDIVRYLRFVAYFVDSRHDLLFPAGSLEQMGRIESSRVATYSFGARLAPTLPLGDRGRVYATAGIGWGRLEYPRMTVDGATSYVIDKRSDSFAEAPFGVGASFEIVKRWLLVDINATGAVIFGQAGTATDHAQAVSGGMIDVGPLPKLDATFTQTLGLVLVL